MRIILISFILVVSSAFRTLPDKYRGLTKQELAKIIDNARKNPSGNKKKSHNKSADTALQKLKDEIKRLKQTRRFSPNFGDEYESIATFERFKGVVDGNIVSSGHPVNFKIDFKDSRKVPSGSYLSCIGTNLASKHNYRIIASCDRLITPSREFKVNVGLKDLYKVDGLRPDHVYTGDEEAIIGEGFSAIMGGIIDARKERVETAIGFSETPTLKNAYINGLVNAAKLANKKSKDHTDNQVVVLAVKDKTEVIIEFKRRFVYENH